MRIRTRLATAGVASLALAGCDVAQRPPDKQAQMVPTTPAPWPPLPTSGFVSGRPATQQDVRDGNAVFVAEVGGKVIGQPLPIDIPQYALHVDGDTQQRTRVIVVQAERAGGIEMVGFRNIATGGDGVGTRPEFELLGRSKPQ